MFWHVGNPREKYCCPTTISHRKTLARKSIFRQLRQKTKILWLLECRQYNKDCEEKKKKRKKHVHCRTARQPGPVTFPLMHIVSSPLFKPPRNCIVKSLKSKLADLYLAHLLYVLSISGILGVLSHNFGMMVM